MDNTANPSTLNVVRLKKFITSNEIFESAIRLRIVAATINVTDMMSIITRPPNKY
jgi:hypothetical protein